MGYRRGKLEMLVVALPYLIMEKYVEGKCYWCVRCLGQ